MRSPSRRAGEKTMLDALLLRLGRATAATTDVPAVLADVCRTLRPALGVRGVAAVAGDPADAVFGPAAASDDTARWVARVQCDARTGPLAAVARSGRPLRTADLLRVGPPELAAAAAEAGTTEALTLPLAADGRVVGALQLLGDQAHPAGPDRAEPLSAVLDVLAARLADVDELRRRTAVGPDPGDDPSAAATAVLPVAREQPAADRPPDAVDGRAEPVDPRGARRSAPQADLDPVTDRFPAVSAAVVADAAGAVASGADAAETTSVLPKAGSRPPAPPSAVPLAAPPAPSPPAGMPPAQRPPGPSEMLVPVPRYHEPGAATFGAAADRVVDDGAGAEPPPAAVPGAGAPADGAAHGAGGGTSGALVSGSADPRPGRRRREP